MMIKKSDYNVGSMFTRSMIKYAERMNRKNEVEQIIKEFERKGYSKDFLNSIYNKVPIEINVEFAEKFEDFFGKSVMKKIATESSTNDIYGAIASWIGRFTSVKNLLKRAEYANNTARFFNDFMRFEIVELGNGNAKTRVYYLGDSYKFVGKVNCEFQQGMVASIPKLTGMPPANVTEENFCAIDIERILKRENIKYIKEEDYILFENKTPIAEKTKNGYRVLFDVRRPDGSIFLNQNKIFNYVDDNGNHFCEYDLKWYNPTKKRWILSAAGLALGIGLNFLDKEIPPYILPFIFTLLGYLHGENIDLKKYEKNQRVYENDLRNDLGKTIIDLQEANSRLKLEMNKKEEAYMAVIKSLQNSLKTKDQYTKEHGSRVKEYSEKIAKRMNLDNALVEKIKIAAELHDIGKIGISDMILNKKSSLSNEEYEEIKSHPYKSEEILFPLKEVIGHDVIKFVLYHHERIDGRGYPYGKKGSELPVGAKILAVADSFDAMSSDRSYRNKQNLEYCISELMIEKGFQFDSIVVDVLIQILKEEENLDDSFIKSIEFEVTKGLEGKYKERIERKIAWRKKRDEVYKHKKESNQELNNVELN